MGNRGITQKDRHTRAAFPVHGGAGGGRQAMGGLNRLSLPVEKPVRGPGWRPSPLRDSALSHEPVPTKVITATRHTTMTMSSPHPIRIGPVGAFHSSSSARFGIMPL
jgi:hypothetical protein